ncbi:MAG: aspartate aminotransferase family protein, partial [Clostridiales Family XIII bacterium]|jgi:glutamate-1-semialdehyde 2,1-aminomutase|nr:aspartate aminotransferase family protein [Clostridiales Family XIII bacterium]
MGNMNKSKELQTRACNSIPLGVNSNGRYWSEGTPYFQKGKGAYVWDVDGNRYIDYRLAFGPVILGYAYDDVDDAVVEAIRGGITPGITTEREIEVAEQIIGMCPALEMVRLVNSGSDATMHSLRVARAYTGRDKIIKFEGGYHGSYECVLFSTYAPPSAYGNRRSPISIPASSGIPAVLHDLIITLPFNDVQALELALQRHGHEVAAIITEPMLGNFGLAEPLPGFMDAIRRLCDQYGVVWILDEVKTGFRIAKGGAQEKYGYKPDLSTYAKALGNGYPVAAYGGKKEIMDIVGKGVTQGGTYVGNGVAAAAAKATLRVMATEDVHGHIDKMGKKLQDGLTHIFRAAKIDCLISPIPGIFSVSFGISQNRDAREWGKADEAYYRKLAAKAFAQGILLDEDPREPWCLSYSHTEADIDETLKIIEKIVKEG